MFSSMRDGTEIEVTIRGMVRNQDGSDFHDGSLRVVDSNGYSHWVYFDSAVHVISPPHAEVKTGQVWETSDGAWFARISRLDLPIRMTPHDMSAESGLATLEVNDFFTMYPAAVLAYDPTGFTRISWPMKSGSGSAGSSGGPTYPTTAYATSPDLENGCSGVSHRPRHGHRNR